MLNAHHTHCAVHSQAQFNCYDHAKGAESAVISVTSHGHATSLHPNRQCLKCRGVHSSHQVPPASGLFVASHTAAWLLSLATSASQARQ